MNSPAGFSLLGPRFGVLPRSHADAERRLDSPLRRSGLAALLAALVLLPFVADGYIVYMACLVAITVISVVGLNILTGYTGLLSIGHAAFNGVGAFACAVAATRWGLPFWLAIPFGGLVAAAAGVLVGLPSLRIKGLYLAIATLAAQFIFLFVVQHWASVTGGDRGLQVPSPQLGGLRLDSDFRLYWLIVPSFALASFYAGIAGALMAYFFRIANPEQYGFGASILQLTAVIVGGLGSILGSVLGSLFMVALPEALKGLATALAGADSARVAVLLASARELVFGLLIVGFLLFEPFGLAEIVRRLRARLAVWPFRS